MWYYELLFQCSKNNFGLRTMCQTLFSMAFRLKTIMPCVEERSSHARLVLVVNEVRQFCTCVHPLILPIRVESCVVEFMIYKGELSTVERKRLF